jgi:hypothetical protein
VLSGVEEVVRCDQNRLKIRTPRNLNALSICSVTIQGYHIQVAKNQIRRSQNCDLSPLEGNARYPALFDITAIGRLEELPEETFVLAATVYTLGPTRQNAFHQKFQKHTTVGIRCWSPTQLLIHRYTAYIWLSGREA